MSTNFSRAASFFIAAALIHFFSPVSFPSGGEPGDPGKFAGSKACASCHPGVYEAWSGTLHAKALISSTEAVSLAELPGLLKKCAEAGVETGEVRYAVGSHWTRRFVTSSGAVLPFVYSLPERRFADYFDKNYKRTDFNAECIGCHVTGVSAGNSPEKGGTAEVRYFEAGVGCEACHGTGADHCKGGDARKIINPRKIDKKRADMICMACHTNGYDASGKYKYPLGYTPGADLMKYFTNMAPKPGQMTSGVSKKFDYAGDNSFDDRARQFEYWKYAFLSKNGLSCSDCLDFRNMKNEGSGMRRDGNKKTAMEFFTKNQFCLTCHANAKPFDRNNNLEETAVIHSGCSFSIPRSPSGAADFNFRASKQPGNSEVECSSCHAAGSVHDHRFIPGVSN